MSTAPRLAHVTLDVADLDRAVAFWTALLGVEVAARFPGFVFLTSDERVPVGLGLQQVPEPKVGKARVHLDLAGEDLDAVSARVSELGGRELAERSAGTIRWRVFADPDGIEFCVAC